METIKDNYSQAIQERPNFDIALVCQKTEKLTCALYKVTDFISDREPLKWKIRAVGTEVLMRVVPFGDSPEIASRPSLHAVLPAISRLVALCDLAKTTGGFSEMNFTILRSEYLALKNKISLQTGQEASSLIASAVEVVLPAEPSRVFEGASKRTRSAPSDKGHVKDNIYPSQATVSERRDFHRVADQSLNTARREEIIKFLRRNGESSIKDIMGVISGCSGKTIQRELASMVSLGVAKRVGDRRWSRYSLA